MNDSSDAYLTPNLFDLEGKNSLGMPLGGQGESVALGTERVATNEGVINVAFKYALGRDYLGWDIAHGGDSAVFFVATRDSIDGIHPAFALKSPNPGFEFSRGARSRFEAECDLWLRNSHLPGVMPLDGLLEIDSRIFLQMPLVLGRIATARNLREYMRVHDTRPHEAAWLAAFSSMGLSSIERMGDPVVHGDLKPENFLLHLGSPNVADFGSSVLQNAVTTDRSRFATRRYLPPEAEDSGVITDVQGDIWSFGQIVNELLGAPQPANVETAGYLELCGELRSLIDKCVLGDPAARPPSFSYVHNQLTNISDAFLQLEDVTVPGHLRAAMTMTYIEPMFEIMSPRAAGQAEAMRRFGRHDAALDLLPRDSDIFGNPQLRYARARVLTDLGQYLEAKSLLWSVLSQLDENEFWQGLRPRALNELGILYRRLKRWGRAKTVLLQAADAAGEWDQFRQAVINLAATHIDIGEVDEGQRLLLQLLQTSPNDAVTIRAFGIHQHQMGNFEGARSLYERALQIDPYQSILHQYLAEVHSAFGEWELASLECALAMRTGSSWSDIGPVLTRIIVADPQVVDTELRVWFETETTDSERETFLAASKLATDEEGRKVESTTSTPLQNRQQAWQLGGAGLWVPTFPGAPRGGGTPVKADPRWPWNDYGAALQWFAALQGDFYRSQQSLTLVLRFLELAAEVGDLQGQQDALSILLGSNASDESGVPLRLQALRIGSVLAFNSGDLERAWTQAGEALALLPRLKTQEHFGIIESVLIAAIQSAEQANDQTLLALYTQLATLREAVLGLSDPATLRTRHNRALLLGSLGLNAQAIAEMMDVVKLRREVLGYNDDATLNSTVLLSRMVGNAGDWPRAAELATLAWNEVLEVCGTRDPRYYMSALELADCLAQSRDYVAASLVMALAIEQLDEVEGTDIAKIASRSDLEEKCREILYVRFTAAMRQYVSAIAD